MKLTILSLFITLLASFSVHAENMVTAKIPSNMSIENGLIKLFNEEAIKKGSPLNLFMKELKANPDNKDYFIDDEITSKDLVTLDSGASAGQFGISYLIFIRAGYKSNTFAVGYLKAYSYGSIDEEDDVTISIAEPAKVTIE